MNGVPSHRLKKLKRAMRDEIRARRDAMPEADRADASRAIAEHVLALPELEGAGTVMVFWSFGSEVDTAPLIAGLVRAGVRVALPRIEGADLVPTAYAPGDPLRSASFGAMEPTAGEELEPAALDVIVVPGVAFDRRGGRVGYGSGFYDRLLARRRPAATVAVGFDLQLVDEVPSGPADVPVDVVVTELETIRRP